MKNINSKVYGNVAKMLNNVGKMLNNVGKMLDHVGRCCGDVYVQNSIISIVSGIILISRSRLDLLSD